MGLLLVLVVILLILGALPAWHHSRQWGYRPSGALSVVLLVVMVLMVMNVIPRGF